LKIKYRCLFCGKEVKRDPFKFLGFCDECELAMNFAKETEKIIKLSAYNNKLTIDEIEELENKIIEMWINSIIYGNSNGRR